MTDAAGIKAQEAVPMALCCFIANGGSFETPWKEPFSWSGYRYDCVHDRSDFWSNSWREADSEALAPAGD